jgi:hypothetical protein
MTPQRCHATRVAVAANSRHFRHAVYHAARPGPPMMARAPTPAPGGAAPTTAAIWSSSELRSDTRISSCVSACRLDKGQCGDHRAPSTRFADLPTQHLRHSTHNLSCFESMHLCRQHQTQADLQSWGKAWGSQSQAIQLLSAAPCSWPPSGNSRVVMVARPPSNGTSRSHMRSAHLHLVVQHAYGSALGCPRVAEGSCAQAVDR